MASKYNFMTAPCLGVQNLHQCIEDTQQEGWEPHLLTFAGMVEVQESAISMKSVKVQSFVLILRRENVVLGKLRAT